MAALGLSATLFACASVQGGASPAAGCEAGLESCLLQAIHERRPREFARLLDAGARPSRPDIAGDTAVHVAAAAPDPLFLHLLIERGIDPDTPNAVTGRTPLMVAILHERRPQIDRLLQAGVDLGRTDRTGNTALHFAAQVNDPGKALQLLRAGAPISTRNAQGQTFQRYLYMTPTRLLSRQARTDLCEVTAWLSSRGLLEVSSETRRSADGQTLRGC